MVGLRGVKAHHKGEQSDNRQYQRLACSAGSEGHGEGHKNPRGRGVGQRFESKRQVRDHPFGQCPSGQSDDGGQCKPKGNEGCRRFAFESDGVGVCGARTGDMSSSRGIVHDYKVMGQALSADSAPRPTATATEGAAMSRVRIHNFSISLDGFGTGEIQTLETPFGHAGHRLHEWMFATRFGHRVVLGQPGGTEGIDDAMADRNEQGIGAEIMGAGKFGPPGWQDDAEWRGWWGDNPPFHTPTYVLTHRPLPSLEMEGGTTFHFLNATPAEALKVAQHAAAGEDIRIGGGATTMRAFLAAGLVDYLHVVQVPILLGRGVRLWDGLEALEQQYDVEAVTTPSGVTHFTFTR